MLDNRRCPDSIARLELGAKLKRQVRHVGKRLRSTRKEPAINCLSAPRWLPVAGEPEGKPASGFKNVLKRLATGCICRGLGNDLGKEHLGTGE